jgi:hypothetical protein
MICADQNVPMGLAIPFKTVLLRQRLDNFNSFGNDLLANTISWNESNAIGYIHNPFVRNNSYSGY